MASEMQQTFVPPGGFWKFILPLLIAIGFPAFVLITNPLIPFANDFHCDPWHYFGFFYIVDQQNTVDATSRMLSRIPEVWLGRLATDLVPGVIADYLNFILLYSGTNLALYFAALRFFDGPRALIATTFVAFNTILLGSLAVTYTGPSVLYNVIGIWLAAEAQRSDGLKRTLILAALGVVLAMSVHGHAYAVECAIAIPLYAVRAERTSLPALFWHLVEIAWKVAAGIVLGTLVIGAINWWFFGGKFLFFASQFEVIAGIDTGSYRIAGWFLKACRGAVFLLAVGAPVLRIAALVRSGTRTAADRQSWLVNIVMLVIAAVMVLDNLLGAYFLEYDYYYVMLLPHIALSVASLFTVVQLSRRRLGVMVIAYVIILGLATLPTIEAIGRLVASPDDGVFSLSLATAALAAAAVAIFSRNLRVASAAMVTTLVLLGCWGFTVRPQRMGRLVWNDSVRAVPRYGRDNYVRVREAMTWLAAHHFKSRPVFWVSIDNGLAETIALPRSFDYCTVEMKLPNLDFTEGSFERDFKAGREIVLADGDASLVERANASLRSHGLSVEEHERKAISYAGVSYWVVIGTLKAVAPAAG